MISRRTPPLVRRQTPAIRAVQPTIRPVEGSMTPHPPAPTGGAASPTAFGVMPPPGTKNAELRATIARLDRRAAGLQQALTRLATAVVTGNPEAQRFAQAALDNPEGDS